MDIFDKILILILLALTSCFNNCSKLTQKYYKENDSVHISLNEDNNDFIDLTIESINKDFVILNITNFSLSEGKTFYIDPNENYNVYYNDEKVEAESAHYLIRSDWYYPIYNLSLNSSIKLNYSSSSIYYTKMDFHSAAVILNEYEGIEIGLYE
jgi:hypothetical protein